MKNAITWFEIPSTQLDKAQAFYEAVLTCKLRREPMGPSEGAVFPYQEGEGDALALAARSLPGPRLPRRPLPARWSTWMLRPHSTPPWRAP
jgi:predicted enzyme related to lactoylglutathione lyase